MHSIATNFVNMSDYNLSYEQKQTLNLGLKFTIKPNKSRKYITMYQNQFNLIKRKLFYRQFFLERQSPNPVNPPGVPHKLLKKHWKEKPINIFKLPQINPKASKQITNYINNTFTNVKNKILYKYKPPKATNIHNKNIKALNTLQQNKTIKITKSDKTNQLVVLNYNDYHAAALDHLQDRKFYQIVNHSAPQIHQILINNYNKIINSHKHKPYFSHIEKLLEYIDPQNQKNKNYLPHIYLNVKTHKTPHSYRPIISGKQWVTQRAAILIDETLKSIITQHYPYIPKDTFDFLHKIEQIQPKLLNIPHENLLLVSFDVQSLYTNIPQEGCAHMVEYLIKKHLPQNQIPPIFFKQLTNWILNHNYFQYDTNTYKQTYGIAMGCVAGGSLANSYLTDWEKAFLSDHWHQQHMVAYYRYFDDGFLIWKGSIDALKDLIDCMNLADPNIKITIEYGKKLQYLDVELTLTNDNQILTRPFRKPTANNFYLNPDSCHPKHIFINVPYNIFFRAFMISNTASTYYTHKDKFTKYLLNSGYTQKQIDDSHKKLQNKYNISKIPSSYRMARLNTLNTILSRQDKQQQMNNKIILPITHWPGIPTKNIVQDWHLQLKDTLLKEFEPLRANSQLLPLARQLIHHKPTRV